MTDRLRGVIIDRTGHIMEYSERTFQDCTRLTMGCLREEPKARKRSNLSALESNKCGENRRIKGDSHVKKANFFKSSCTSNKYSL